MWFLIVIVWQRDGDENTTCCFPQITIATKERDESTKNNIIFKNGSQDKCFALNAVGILDPDKLNTQLGELNVSRISFECCIYI